MGYDQKFLDFFNLSKNDYTESSQGLLVHKSIENDLKRMQAAALEDGVAIALLSSYRSFEQQLNIWNEKATGKRVIRNDDEMIVNIEDLNEDELIHAIMRYSAIPGLSRHHFGTDMDVYDPNSIDDNYKVKLVASEYDDEGPFAKLNQWMDKNLESFGFYRPYSHDQGRLAQEPWHISHRETATNFVGQLTSDKMLSFFNQFSNNEFKLIEKIKNHLDEYLRDYVEPY